MCVVQALWRQGMGMDSAAMGVGNALSCGLCGNRWLGVLRLGTILRHIVLGNRSRCRRLGRIAAADVVSMIQATGRQSVAVYPATV